MRWVVTKHAIDRYLERTNAEMTERIARIALLKEAEGAAPLKERTDRGDAMWRAPCGLILITKREKRRDWIVTVVTEEERAGITEHELEILQEAAASMPVTPAKKRINGDARWIDDKAHLEERIRILKQRCSDLQDQAQEAPRLRKEVKALQRNQESGKTLVRYRRHALRMEADSQVAKRCLRAALQALRGIITAEEAEAYIRECEPTLVSPEFIEAPQRPPATRETLYQRMLAKNWIAVDEGTQP